MLLTFISFLLVTVVTCLYADQFSISSSEMTITVNSTTGSISSIATLENDFQLDTNGYSWLGDDNKQSIILNISVQSDNNTFINIIKHISVYTLDSKSYNETVNLNETFTIMNTDKSTIIWKLQILPQSTIPWRTVISTQFNITNNNNHTYDEIYYWTMHSGTSQTNWTNILDVMIGEKILRTQLGNGYIYDSSISTGREIMPFPLSIFISKALNYGYAFIYDINDYILGASMDINSHFQLFQRYSNQLNSKNKPLEFKTYIRINRGSNWRDTLNWTMNYFSEYFLPYSSNTNNIGHGLYSCASYEVINTTFVVSESGANLNWDASFWWPYIGYTLPPNNTWQSDYGGGEESQCGNYKHGEIVSRNIISKHYNNMQNIDNITTTAYFNLFEFGQNIIWPLNINTSYDANNWTNSSIYLWTNLNSSLLFPFQYTNWQNAVLMDPGTSEWSQFLINQTNEHLISFNKTIFKGISIDRVDHTILYNHNRDDGISWCEHPCASMLIAWKLLVKQIGNIIHNNNSKYIITSNYQKSRMDLLIASDIIFTEQSNKIHLNAVGLSSMGMPSIMWVYNDGEMLNDIDGPHAYFQQRLYMKVNLMVPVYGADHSITSNAPTNVKKYYTVYGPLFRVLRGVKWWLKADTVTIVNNDGNALINSFLKNSNHNIVIVTVLGNWNISQIDLNITGSNIKSCSSININGKWIPINVEKNNHIINVTNLVKGCAVVECVPLL